MATRYQKELFLEYFTSEFPGSNPKEQQKFLNSLSEEELNKYVDILIKNNAYPEASKETIEKVSLRYNRISAGFLKRIDAQNRRYIVDQLASLPEAQAERLARSVLIQGDNPVKKNVKEIARRMVEMAKNLPEKQFLHSVAAQVTEREGGGKVFRAAVRTYKTLKKTYTQEQLAGMHERVFPQVTEKGGQQFFQFTTKIVRRRKLSSYIGRRKSFTPSSLKTARRGAAKEAGALYIYGSNRIKNERTIRKLLYFSGNIYHKKIIANKLSGESFNLGLIDAAKRLGKEVSFVRTGGRLNPVPSKHNIKSALIVWDKNLYEQGDLRRVLEHFMRNRIQTQIYVPDKRQLKTAFEYYIRAKTRIKKQMGKKWKSNVYIMDATGISKLPFKSDAIRKRANSFTSKKLAEYSRKYIEDNPYSDFLVRTLAPKISGSVSRERTSAEQRIIDIINEARIFILDTETTGTAIKTPKAKIWSLSFGKYNPLGQYRGRATNIQKVAYSKFASTEQLGLIDTVIAKVNLTKDKYPKYGMVKVRNEVVSYGGKFKRFKGAKGNRVISAHEAIAQSEITNDDMFNFIVRAYQRVAGQDTKGRQVEQGGVLIMQNTSFEYSFMKRMIMEGNREQRAARIARTVYNVPATFSKEVIANLPEKERMRFYYVDLEKYPSSYVLFGDTDPELFALKEKIRKSSIEVKFGLSTLNTRKAYKAMYRDSRNYLELLVSKIANQKNNTRGLHIDFMNIMAATNALLQESGYRRANAHIFTGTALDLLKVTMTGTPMSHMSEQDVSDTGMILKHVFENRIAPLLAGQKLTPKEAAIVYLEDIATKKYQEKNIAMQVYDTYKDIISQLELMHSKGQSGNAKYNVRLKEFLKHGDSPFMVTSADPATGVAVRVELSKLGSQKVSMADFEQKIVESYQNIHGAGQSENIAKYTAEASIVYERYKRFLEKDVLKLPGGALAGEKGQLSSIKYNEAMQLLSAKEEKQRSAAKLILAETGRTTAKIDQFVKEGINPKAGIKAMSLGEKIQTLFANEHQFYKRIEEGLNISNKISGQNITLNSLDKKVIKELFIAEQYSLRMKAVGIGALGFAVLAAFSRSQREQTPDDTLKSRAKLAERFNWYFEGTGATVMDGNPFYTKGIPSTLDRSAYGKNNVLENIQPTIDTDFSSPFIKASASTFVNHAVLNKQITDSRAVVLNKGGLYTGRRTDKEMNIEVHAKLRQSLYGGNWVDPNQDAQIF